MKAYLKVSVSFTDPLNEQEINLKKGTLVDIPVYNLDEPTVIAKINERTFFDLDKKEFDLIQ